MEHKFGVFESVEQLNMAAAGLKKEGDEESLILLAVENGLTKEDAEDYLDDVYEELASPTTAALGKLKVEQEEMNTCEIMEDWVEYIRVKCIEDWDIARAVFDPKKTIEGCIAEILKWSFAHQYEVPKEIMEAAGVKVGRCTLGIPGSGTVKELIRAYYLGK